MTTVEKVGLVSEVFQKAVVAKTMAGTMPAFLVAKKKPK